MYESSAEAREGRGRLPSEFAPAERASAADIARQHRKLESLRFVQDFLDAMPNMSVVLNAERQIVMMNRAFQTFLAGEDGEGRSTDARRELFEATVTAALGKRPGEAVGCVHAGESDGGCGTTRFCRYCGAVRAILNSQTWQGLDVQECRLTVGAPDGREASVDFRVWAQAITVEGETFTVFSLVDISNEKRREALEKIFFHDVMNTAGGVRGLAELLAHDEVPQAELHEAVEIMTKSAEQLLEEIAAQRALAAAESGDLEVSPLPLHSLEVLRQAVNVMRASPSARGRSLRIAPDADAVAFSSDPVLLRRVLVNLIKNALEAEPSGGVVTASARQASPGVELTVHNPSEMPEEAKAQVFQRSFSTKGSGRGLGTYSIKLLSQHYLYGRVSFTSTAEDGTTFVVRLPASIPSAS